MKTSIDIELRVHDKKEVLCYIPKVNGVSVMSGYIIKESIGFNGNKTDNLELAEFFLQKTVKELELVSDKYLKFRL